MTNAIVILGKRSVRQSEIPHLETFGKALAIRGKQLITTRSEGVATIVANAYIAAGGKPIFLTNTNHQQMTEEHPVIAFTDTKYAEQLDANTPHWRNAGWLVIHNPKATQEAAGYLTQLLNDWNTPIA